MFEAVPVAFPEDARKKNPSLSLETRTKIRELRARKMPYKIICETLKVSMDTVRRYSETKKRHSKSNSQEDDGQATGQADR
jgi:hypothetical protein